MSWNSLLRTCALAIAIGAGLLLGAGPAAAAGPVDITASEAGGVRSYWTPERMREAEPMPPVHLEAEGGTESRLRQSPLAAARGAAYTRTQVTNPAEESVRMHGKVFLTVKGGRAPGDYVCSGTALDSNNGSVVWSAGHCIFDTEGGGYAANWLFVPAYSNGNAPFGEWPAEKLASPDPWREGGNSSYDYSAAKVAENGSGQTLAEVVGGRGIAFNQKRQQPYSSFGYPAEQPPLAFNGEREFRCDSAPGGTDNPPGSGPNTNWIGCDMTGGSSGGGWVIGDTLLGVNSYSYCLALVCEQRLYGPYFDGTAKQLYKQIAGEAKYCQDKKVTILGTSGADELVGTGGKDVIKAGGGKDVIKAKGGKDKVCAGGGKDEVDGGGGKDKLKGDDGADRLKGGPGKDTCNGGAGKDSAKGCEKEKKIP